jgi:peroxiredoxin
MSPKDDFIQRTKDREVLAEDGTPRRFGDLVMPGPTFIAFLRHFGCVGCDMQVTALMPRQPELRDLGVRIVFVGSGDAQHVQGFIERHGLGGRGITVVTDPTCSIFEAASLVRSAWATFGPAALWSEIRAIGRGERPGRRQGDRYQQGGAFLTDEENRVVFRHENRYVGDCARIEDIVDEALRLRIARAARENEESSIPSRGII